jgi:hypothetical protein
MQIPYYLDLSIGFDRPGLSPGASASFFADTDIYTPEPETAALATIAILLLAVFGPKLSLGECGPARNRNLQRSVENALRGRRARGARAIGNYRCARRVM